MSNHLGAARVKLARADEHLSVLRRQVDRETYTGPDFIQIRQDGPWYVVTCQPLKRALPPRLAAICGDAIHNMRSSLDYVVTGLVIEAGVRPTRHNAFPLYAKTEDWERLVASPSDPKRSPLYGLDPDGQAWAIIRNAQPQHATVDGSWSLLGMLNRMANWDKHRSLYAQHTFPSLRGLVESIGHSPDVRFAEWSDPWFGPLSRDEATELVRVRYTPDTVDAHVHFEGSLTLEPTFGDGTFQLTMGDIIDMRSAVGDLVESFALL